MNPLFLKKIRLRIREMRDMNALYKESKTPPREIRLSMMLLEDKEFPNHGHLNFFDSCPKIYPLFGDELEYYKKLFIEKEIEMYPHL